LLPGLSRVRLSPDAVVPSLSDPPNPRVENQQYIMNDPQLEKGRKERLTRPGKIAMICPTLNIYWKL
jgi:hypothetical protein